MHYNIEEKIYACWMATLYGIGRKKLHDLVHVVGSYREAYQLNVRQVEILLGDAAGKWQQYKKATSPLALWDNIVKKEISFTYYGAMDFPQKLMFIPDPPLGLFYLGSLPMDDEKVIAMIGARKYSDYGRCMAEHFAERLARAGITIVSGMAMGIDGISQRTALKAGGKSYAVLGCGVDVIYPQSNEKLYYELIEKGGVMSEVAPGTEPRPMLFPQRNRIISALSDVVLVVEAREKSGTFITVDMALEQGREVYAIPGRCTDGLSMGCNKLLRQGAGIAVTPQELLEDLKWTCGIDKTNKRRLQYELSDIAEKIYTVLDIMSCTQDDIIEKLRKRKVYATVPEICRGLLELEMQQIVSRTGGQYRLIKPKI
ncbi:MAG: DNA-processing protein DprA [Lachnospiraceae bacterium]|nr:DNA-processing protein DprA [Lachnospiraceae bacterium]